MQTPELINSRVASIEERLMSELEKKTSEAKARVDSLEEKVGSIGQLKQDLAAWQHKVFMLEDEVGNLKKSQASAVKTLYGSHSNLLQRLKDGTTDTLKKVEDLLRGQMHEQFVQYQQAIDIKLASQIEILRVQLDQLRQDRFEITHPDTLPPDYGALKLSYENTCENPLPSNSSDFTIRRNQQLALQLKEH